MRLASSLAVALFAIAAKAQTETSCNPMKKECPVDPALGLTLNQTFNADSSLDDGVWNVTAKQPSFTDEGMVMSLEKAGESVTIVSQFYIFWGTTEVLFKAAPGAGIISSLVLLSDDLDEIDWEIIGNNDTHVENNYYGKGNQTQMNAKYIPSPKSPQSDYHNYTVDWSQEKIDWIYDGNVVRSMAYADALKDGYFFPQTPMHFSFSLWPAGDSDRIGTSQWAGGKVDWSKGPYDMTVKSVKIIDGTKNATSYSYGDTSGSFKSIQVKKEGKSDQAKIASKPPPVSAPEAVKQKFNGLSQGAKIAAIAVPLGVIALATIIGCICCVKQRKLGRRERAIEDARWEKENAEMLAYRKQMAGGAFSQSSGGYHPAPVASPRPF